MSYHELYFCSAAESRLFHRPQNLNREPLIEKSFTKQCWLQRKAGAINFTKVLKNTKVGFKCCLQSLEPVVYSLPYTNYFNKPGPDY